MLITLLCLSEDLKSSLRTFSHQDEREGPLKSRPSHSLPLMVHLDCYYLGAEVGLSKLEDREGATEVIDTRAFPSSGVGAAGDK